MEYHCYRSIHSFELLFAVPNFRAKRILKPDKYNGYSDIRGTFVEGLHDGETAWQPCACSVMAQGTSMYSMYAYCDAICIVILLPSGQLCCTDCCF